MPRSMVEWSYLHVYNTTDIVHLVSPADAVLSLVLSHLSLAALLSDFRLVLETNLRPL